MILALVNLYALFWGLLRSIQKFRARDVLPSKTRPPTIRPSVQNQVVAYVSVAKRLETIVGKQGDTSKTPTTRPASCAISHSITIPDTLRLWPWPRHLNSHFAICKEESTAWCEALHAFSSSAQRAFNLCDFSLLASLGFPLLNKDGCRVGCDAMNLYFIIDEHTDVADGKTARMQADVVMDVLRNPDTRRPAREWVGGEVAYQFWQNVIKTATPISQLRIIDRLQTYTDAVVRQAEDRVAGHIHDAQSYFEARREAGGVRPTFAILAIHMNIPEEVMEHPVIVKLEELSNDLIIIDNDLYSYNIEQAKDNDGHNLVRIVMEQYNTDTQTAMNCIGQLHDELAEQFLTVWKDIPTFGGPVDREIRTYADGLGNWVRANEAWSFESGRYFGTRCLEVQLTREDKLLPRSSQRAQL